MSNLTSASSFEMVAKTFRGLEPVLASELERLGARDVKCLNRAVSFAGNLAMLYKANLWLRTALRILRPLSTFRCRNEVELYSGIMAVKWDRYFSVDDTLAIDTVVKSDHFPHSLYAGLKAKDAIVDQFRNSYGKRPSVDTQNPTVQIHIHLMDSQCTVLLDSSGESMHRRGYRKHTNIAPLNEVLAAGMLLLAGWDGQSDFVDPMCGSGTLPIEAALIAYNIPPGIFRGSFAFEKWKDFDKELFETIYNDDSSQRDFSHKIYGSDLSATSVKIAMENAKMAAMHQKIIFSETPFEALKAPAEKGLLVTNPPYGERMTKFDMGAFYKVIGDTFKHGWKGWDAWLISSNLEALKSVGLRPADKFTLFNGALECRFSRYPLFSGTVKEYKSRENPNPTLKPKPKPGSRPKDRFRG
ncbi:MAG: class I SAM-dependent RNA methyltransferase [Bacteroidales bacterium]